MTDKLSDGDLVSLISILRHAMTRGDVPVDLSPALLGAAKELDCLRAELTAARTVADGEVAACVRNLNEGSGMGHWSVIMAFAADLLTRLSAAKEEAERERDEAREERDAALKVQNWIDNNSNRAIAAERERDSARADALADLTDEEMAAGCLALNRSLPLGSKWVKGEVHQVWTILTANRALTLIDKDNRAIKFPAPIRALKPVQGEQ